MPGHRERADHDGCLRVHVVRASLRHACRARRGPITKGLREVHTDPTMAAAEARFADFETDWGGRCPVVIKLWRNAWEQLTHQPTSSPRQSRI